MNETSTESILNLLTKDNIYYRGARTEMMDFIPKCAKTAVDIGCAEGCFGASLKALGMEVWGVEMNPDAAAIAKEKLDKVLIGDVFNLINDLPAGYFDCIICNDVLEHLVDPYTLLLNLKSRLSRNGVVVCSIPNVRYYPNLIKLLIEKQWKYEDMGILDKTHLRFFTEKSIRDTFDALDYDIVKLSGINANTFTWQLKILNFILRDQLSDTKYIHFACVAKPRNR